MPGRPGIPARPLKPPVTEFQLLAIWNASIESASVIKEKNGPLPPSRRNTISPISNASVPLARATKGSSR